MTALSAPRPTPSLETGLNVWQTFDVAADAVIYPGAVVAINASGYLVTASADLALHVVGIAVPDNEQLNKISIAAGAQKAYIDATGLSNGDVKCKVQRKVLALMANGSSGITIANIGSDCYLGDDQTVYRTNGTAQVTRGDVEYNGTDNVGYTVDGITVYVPSNTSDDQTATDLRDKWNSHAVAKDLAAASIDLAGATSYCILAFKDSVPHAVTSYSPATADITSITNTTAAVAGTRPRAGKIHNVETRGVWVEIDG